jgi:enterochelin esterase-like enzyme
MIKKILSVLLVSMLLVTLLNVTAITTSAAPPAGFDVYQSNIPHGAVTTITYHSNTTNTDRKAMIYTPPGYSASQKYNVLYLLHGIGGDHTEWYNGGRPDIILDNLYAQNKLAPMIVVMPNGRAMADDRPTGDIYAADKVAAFENFQYDLTKDLIPYIESHYPVLTGRENRAIAGLSMGGGQSLNFGLKYMDLFAYAGGFSPAPNTYATDKLAPNPAEVAQKMKVVYVSCGIQDSLYSIAQGVHDYFTKNNVPHTWYSAPGNHDMTFWKDSLYQYAQLIFKGIASATPTSTAKPSPTSTPTSKPGSILDVNNDGAINISDVMIVAGAFNTAKGKAGYVEAYDLNKDGAINISDIMMIAAKFNTLV